MVGKTFYKNIAIILFIILTMVFMVQCRPKDNVEPNIIEHSPNGNDIAPNIEKFTVTFDKDMNESTINQSSFYLSKTSDDTVINADSIIYTDKTATYNITTELDYNTEYTVIVKNTVADLSGNTLKNDYSWTFTTTSEPDNTPPSITNKIPDADASNVPSNSKIAITFSEDIEQSTITNQNIIIKTTSDNTVVAGGLLYSNKVVEFTPDNDLEFLTEYNITVKTSITDLVGNNLDKEYSWSFTTGEAPDLDAPSIVEHTPLADAEGVATDISEISVTFNEAVMNINDTTFIVEDGDSNPLTASEISVNEAVAVFTIDGELSEMTTYTVLLKGGAGGISDVAGNVPAEDYSFSFTTGDFTNPYVVSHTPTTDETEVAWDLGTIEIIFNEPIKSNPSPTLTLEKTSDSTPVSGSLTVYASQGKLTLSNLPNLELETQYTVKVSDVVDMNGNSMSAEYSFNFTSEEPLELESKKVYTTSYGVTMLETVPTTQSGDTYINNVDIGTFIYYDFNKELDPNSIDSVISIDRDTLYNPYGSNETNWDSINLTVELDPNDSSILIVRPIIQFYTPSEDEWKEAPDDGSGYVNWEGIRNGYRYDVALTGGSAGIKSLRGIPLSGNDEWNFETTDVDWGLYWFGTDGACEKYISGQDNQYYNDSNDVIIYGHGWQDNSTKRDYWRPSPKFFMNEGDEDIIPISEEDASLAWINDGWNLGMFMWAQFADEGEVKDAQAKMWTDSYSGVGMRYRLPDDSQASTNAPFKSSTELFHEAYKSCLASNTASEIRLMGHSLGNQIVTNLAKHLIDDHNNGVIADNLLPTRITHMDPFWSKDEWSYLGGIRVGEKVYSLLTEIINYYDNNITSKTMAYEYFKTSHMYEGARLIGGFWSGGAGQQEDAENISKIAYFNVVLLGYMHIGNALNISHQHYLANFAYLSSRSYKDITGYNWYANSTNDFIRDRMNYYDDNMYYDNGAVDITHTQGISISPYVGNTIGGVDTPTTSDDSYVACPWWWHFQDIPNWSW